MVNYRNAFANLSRDTKAFTASPCFSVNAMATGVTSARQPVGQQIRVGNRLGEIEQDARKPGHDQPDHLRREQIEHGRREGRALDRTLSSSFLRGLRSIVASALGRFPSRSSRQSVKRPLFRPRAPLRPSACSHSANAHPAPGQPQ